MRKTAEELLAKYPSMFSTNFEANKKALEKVAIIRNHALRNQIAGAISSMVSEQAPAKPDSGTELEELIEVNNSSTAEESVTTSEISQQAK